MVASLVIAVVVVARLAFKVDWKRAGAIGEATVFWGFTAMLAGLTFWYWYWYWYW